MGTANRTAGQKDREPVKRRASRWTKVDGDSLSGSTRRSSGLTEDAMEQRANRDPYLRRAERERSEEHDPSHGLDVVHSRDTH